MEIAKIKQQVFKDDENYSFLDCHPNLGSNIILLGLGGSYSYGTNNENSDIDLRGIATNLPTDILCQKDFEQVVETSTDTTIYSVEKILNLFCACNPNTIELLGLDDDQYFICTKEGKMLLDNKELFLSKVAVQTFGGYANAQLRRLENKAARVATQEKQEENILKSIENAYYTLSVKYNIPENAIKLYLDDATQDEMEKEIFMDSTLKHYPLRDYYGLYSEMNNIVKDYSKIGKRNQNAMGHDKLGKHMMHLVRLYFMCFDILEKKEIHTHRVAEHDLLMEIRNGKFLDENRHPIPEFYEFVNELEARLDYDKKNTELPDKPDYKKVEELHVEINKGVIKRWLEMKS